MDVNAGYRCQVVSRKFFIGVDLGQTNDPTAIAVLERKQQLTEGGSAAAEKTSIKYVLKHLERLPLGLSYVAQAAYVGELKRREPIVSSSSKLIIDQTGVGRAVFDIFRKARLDPIGLTITGGSESSRVGNGWHVSKMQLMSRMQASLHNGDLRIVADLKDGPALVKELQEFRASYTSAGNVIFGAREGTHDDLVLAVAIALWEAAHGGELVKMKLVGM